MKMNLKTTLALIVGTMSLNAFAADNNQSVTVKGAITNIATDGESV